MRQVRKAKTKVSLFINNMIDRKSKGIFKKAARTNQYGYHAEYIVNT